jgi:hypothetical protein
MHDDVPSTNSELLKALGSAGETSNSKKGDPVQEGPVLFRDTVKVKSFLTTVRVGP